MASCDNREEFLKYIDKIETSLSTKIKDVDSKIDTLRADFNEQVGEHREMEVYVKNLYKRFDDLTSEMQRVVSKLDTYIITLTAIQNETKQNSEFRKSGKDLIFEIIKWLVLLVLGVVIGGGM